MSRDVFANRIHTGDTLEWLPTLPDGCAQLIIADPPYNIGKKFGDVSYNDLEIWLPWCRTWLEECLRLLSPDGNIFVYGIHNYLSFLHVAMHEMGYEYRRQVVWHYENGFAGYTKSLAAHYEPILWFSKSSKFYYDPIREPYKSQERLKYAVNKNGKTWTPHPDGRLAGDVWSFPTLAGRRFRDEKVAHPTQKPLNLTRRIVDHFSEPGSLVVVPFAGSGTECVAARELGRDFAASELNPDYVEVANGRLELLAAEAVAT
jgi:DNA modification methylase